MTKLNLPSHLNDKIFQIHFNSNNSISKIVSYFPLSELEKQETLSNLNKDFDDFSSIFTDTITKEEWNRTKKQIKKKFKNDLFDIDKT